MKINKGFLLLLIILSIFFDDIFCARYKAKETPKLTIVLVVDQLAFHYIPKLREHFRYGLKNILENGVSYNKAYHPHGVPETTPGHHGISTGTCPKDHGVPETTPGHHGISTGTCPKDHGAIANDWIGFDGKVVEYAGDPDYPSLTSNERVSGYSACKTRVDNLSDQFIFKSVPGMISKVFSISLKSYPAISMAGKMGKAFWLDQESGEFSSSKAYYKTLPEWVRRFNEKKKAEKLKSKVWELMYPEDSKQYDFPYIRNYDYAGIKESMIGSNSDKVLKNLSLQKYYMFMKTPYASKLLLEFAEKCLDANLSLVRNDKMILWVSLSNLDLLCHFYGPHCIETIDLIYHIDKQIKDFIEYVNKKVGEKNYLLVLTADHGICPIPEIMEKQGFHLAKRIKADSVVDELNKMIKKKYGIENMILGFEPTCFRLDHQILKGLGNEVKTEIYKSILKYLKSIKGIKNAWTFNQLANSTFESCQLENFYKNQLYKGRSGDIICQPEPYCQITNYSTGTSHLSPYDYDTHVPLIIYQKDRFERRVINEKVWIQQLPVTLSKILNIGIPSASIYDSLPGLKI